MTQAESDSITDFTDLECWFKLANNPTVSAVITAVQLVLPDGGPALMMGATF